MARSYNSELKNESNPYKKCLGDFGDDMPSGYTEMDNALQEMKALAALGHQDAKIWLFHDAAERKKYKDGCTLM